MLSYIEASSRKKALPQANCLKNKFKKEKKKNKEKGR